MKIEEIVTKLGKVEDWEQSLELPGTFIERVASSDTNTIRYLRPVSAKALVATSTRNLADDKSLDLADKVLTFAAARVAQLLENPVSKVTPFNSGNKKLDSFLALGPRVAQFHAAD